MAISPQSNDLAIIIDGQAFGGWTDIRVMRGCERMPSSFDIGATERYPGQLRNVAISAGSPCQVKIGPDLVITGYVDRVIPSLSAGQHALRIQGRSKCEDIVDCSVTSQDLAGLQWQGGDLVKLAGLICKPFGIAVKSLVGASIPIVGPGATSPIPINVIFGETGYEVLERVARYLQVLVYDDTDGALVLGRVGAGGSMASGFAQGVNVQEASGALSMDQRYSDYLPSILSYQMFGQVGGALTALPVQKDAGVPRYRPLYVVSEQVNLGQAFAVQRAQWELARRYGRSQAIRLVVDNWRDSSGALWRPNAYAQVYVPAVKIAPTDPWIIGEVTFARDASRGTTAELMMMPREAYMQEPIILMPFGWYQGSGNDVPGGAPT